MATNFTNYENYVGFTALIDKIDSTSLEETKRLIQQYLNKTFKMRLKFDSAELNKIFSELNLMINKETGKIEQVSGTIIKGGIKNKISAQIDESGKSFINLSQNMTSAGKDVDKLTNQIINLNKEIAKQEIKKYEVGGTDKALQLDINRKKRQYTNLLETRAKMLPSEDTTTYGIKTDLKRERKELISSGIAKIDTKRQIQEEYQSYKLQSNYQDEILNKKKKINQLMFDYKSHEQEIKYEQEQLTILQEQLNVEKQKNKVKNDILSKQLNIKESKIISSDNLISAKSQDKAKIDETSQSINRMNYNLTEYLRLQSDIQNLSARGWTKQGTKNITARLEKHKIAYEKEYNSLKKSGIATEELIKADQRLESANNQLAVSEANKNKQFRFFEEFAKSASRVIFYTLTYRFLRMFINGVKDAIQVVTEFNKVMTNIQMITGYTDNQIKNLGNNFANLASQVGATAAEVADASLLWLQQGKTVEETAILTRASMVFSKVAIIESSQATEYLTATMNAYGISVENVMSIVDSMASIDMSAAVSSSELAEALSRTANSANNAGVELNKVLSYIAVIEQQTRMSSSKVGEALKTIFARMGNIKIGKFLSDESENLSDVQKILKSIGINLIDESTKSFRNFGDVLDEIGSKWDNYNNITKNAIATAIAGTRQRESFLALMNDYTTAIKLETVANESSGFALQKMEIYLNNIEAATNNLKNTWQTFAKEITNSEQIKFFINIGSSLLKILQGINKALSNTIGVIAVGSLGILTLINIFKSAITTGTKFNQGLQSIIKFLLGVDQTAKISAATINWWAIGISVAITAVTAAIVYGVQKQKEKLEELKTKYNESIEKFEETTDKLKSLEDISEKWGNVLKNKDLETAVSLQEELSDILGYNVNIFDMSTDSYNNATEALSYYNTQLLDLIDTIKNLKQTGLLETISSAEALFNEQEIIKTGIKEGVIFKTERRTYIKALQNMFAEYSEDKEKTKQKYKFSGGLLSILESFEDESSTLYKNLKERAKPLSDAYTKYFLSIFEDKNISSKMQLLLSDIFNSAFMFASTSVEVQDIYDKLSPQLLELDTLFKNYLTELSKENIDVTATTKAYSDISDKITILAEAYPQLIGTLNVYKDSLNSIAPENNKVVYDITNITSAIDNQIEALKELSDTYKILTDAEKTYFNSKASIIKDLIDLDIDNLSLDAKRAILGLSYTEEEKNGKTIRQRTGDYSAISDNETISILQALDNAYNKYQQDIANVTETSVLQNEDLTNEYERQVSALEKQFEIRQKDLEIEKERINLIKAQSERNTFMYINGKWQWMANPETVLEAQKKIKELEQEKETTILESEYQYQIDTLTSKTEQLSANIKIWESTSEAMATNGNAVADLFGQLATQSQFLSTAFKNVLSSVLSNELYSDVLNDLYNYLVVGSEQSPAQMTVEEFNNFLSGLGVNKTYDSGGSLGINKGFFYKNTNKEEVVLSPENTLATKSLLNKLPKFDSIVNKLLSKITNTSTPNVDNKFIKQDNSTNFTVGQLNITSKSNNFDEIINEARTKISTQQ